MQKITEMWREASIRLEDQSKIKYGVYYEYESDYRGDYSLSVATQDDYEPIIEIPDNQKYEIFKVDISDEHGIFKTWKKIWEQEEVGTLERAYTYDFEKYFPNGEIEVHIAIK
jgi:hypothetical protein